MQRKFGKVACQLAELIFRNLFQIKVTYYRKRDIINQRFKDK